MSLGLFVIESKLGSGSYSTVYKVMNPESKQLFALKKVKLLELIEKERENALIEVQILSSIRHPNIILYKEVFIDFNSSSLCLIMEYAEAGDLFEKIMLFTKNDKRFEEEEIWDIIIQIVKGLKALHDLSIYHRDLKSSNIFLFSDGRVKIGDMNVSKISLTGSLKTQTGTPYYASPELWKDLPYSEKSDIWSLGCLIYEITMLKLPFQSEEMEGLAKKITRGIYPKIKGYSNDLIELISSLLQIVPEKRPSCTDILLLKSVQKRFKEKFLVEILENNNNIYENIIFNFDLKKLEKKLPKKNYEEIKIKTIDIEKYNENLKKEIERSIEKSMNNIEEFKKNNNNNKNKNEFHKIKKESTIEHKNSIKTIIKKEINILEPIILQNSERELEKRDFYNYKTEENNKHQIPYPIFDQKIPKIKKIYGLHDKILDKKITQLKKNVKLKDKKIADSYLKLPDIINKTEVKVKPIATLKKPIELRLKLQEKYSDLKKAYQIYLTMIKP